MNFHSHMEKGSKKFEIGSIFDIEEIAKSEEFPFAIPTMLNFLDPQNDDDLKEVGLSREEHGDTRGPDKVSFNNRKIRADFYNSLSKEKLDDIVGYMCRNQQGERLIKLYNAMSFDKQVAILKRMMEVAFSAVLSSYTREVQKIRGKISRGYVQSAKNIKDAIHSINEGDAMKAIMFLNNNPEKVGHFVELLGNGKEMNKVVREVLKWVPKGDGYEVM